MEMFALQAARRLPREDMADAAITNNISELQLIILLRFSIEVFLRQMVCWPELVRRVVSANR